MPTQPIKRSSGSITHPITGEKSPFKIKGQIRRHQTGLPKKLIVLQKLQFNNDGRVELRLAYYVKGKKPRMRNKWVWGQYAPLMPARDFRAIVRRAERQGWI
jgi:hypothetical protein